MEEPEEGFTVVDKRRAAADGSAPAPAEPIDDDVGSDIDETDDDVEDTDAEPDADGPAHRLAPRDRLLMSIDILHQGAWIAMGLITDPATRAIERDMEGARALIDGVAALADAAKLMVDDTTRRDLQTLVANLRINFIQQSKA